MRDSSATACRVDLNGHGREARRDGVGRAVAVDIAGREEAGTARDGVLACSRRTLPCRRAPLASSLGRGSTQPRRGAPYRGSRAAPRLAAADRSRRGRHAPDAAPDRPDVGDRAGRRSRRLDAPRLVVPARAAAAGARRAEAVRAQRARAADERRRALPRGRRRVAAVGADARLAARERLVQARRSRPARRVGAARVTRHPRHERRAVEVDRLDAQPERDADARVPDDARRGRDLRSRRPRTAVGRARARVPEARARPVGRGGHAHQERAPSAVARHRAREEHGDAARAGRRRRRRCPGDGRRRPGRVARRPGTARSRLRGTDGAAVAVRPPRLRPRACAAAVRLRVHARDVQAGGEAALGLLRAARAPRGPARRQGRRDRRPQALGARGARDPRGRSLHARDDEGGARRARVARVVARPRARRSQPGSVPSRYGPPVGRSYGAYASRPDDVSVSTPALCFRATSTTG